MRQLLEWVRSHGNRAWIENGRVAILSKVRNPDGTWGTELDYAATMREARAILGY